MKYWTFPVLLTLCLALFPVLAQEEAYDPAAGSPKSGQPPPEGMEKIRLGGSAELLVPEGAKTRKVGAQVIVEGTKEYMARRFSEMEKKIADLEKRQAELEAELKALRKELEDQKKAQMKGKASNYY